MSNQNYSNHTHRPVPTAIGLACWLVAVAGFCAFMLVVSSIFSRPRSR